MTMEIFVNSMIYFRKQIENTFPKRAPTVKAYMELSSTKSFSFFENLESYTYTLDIMNTDIT